MFMKIVYIAWGILLNNAIYVNEYQGIYFVQAPEFDDQGFFLDLDDAMEVVEEYEFFFPQVD